MKTNKKMLFISLLLTLSLLVMMAVPVMSIAAQPPVNLGTTSTFAVLAGSTITNTGATTINGDAGGDIGLSPGTAFPGQAGVTTTGTVYLSDGGGVASAAKTALVTAYNDAAGRVVDTTIAAALGGGETLTPGTYNSASSIQINGTLTLDALGDPNAVFVFQAGSTLTTAVGSNIVLANGARYCRIFWQVGSSATLGTNSHFVGHIFAMDSITANNGATVQGQLLARNGAVTLENNTIMNGLCATIVAPPVPPAPSDSPGTGPTPPVYPPLINVVKTPAPLALINGGGLVTYTYKVSNPGIADLSNVTVTDDKISVVCYVSGDLNSDNLLQNNETWIYTAQANLNATMTNTAIAKGNANGITATDVAYATVVVIPTVVVTTTVTGGQIPKTGMPLYELLLIAAVLMLVGAIGWRTRKRYE